MGGAEGRMEEWEEEEEGGGDVDEEEEEVHTSQLLYRGSAATYLVILLSGSLLQSALGSHPKATVAVNPCVQRCVFEPLPKIPSNPCPFSSTYNNIEGVTVTYLTPSRSG